MDKPSSSYLSASVYSDGEEAVNHLDEKMTILCPKCEDYIEVRSIQKHRDLHRALELFQYSVDNIPNNLKQLLKRRRAIVTEITSGRDSENPVPACVLHRVDAAFELLKYKILVHDTDILKQEIQSCRSEVNGEFKDLHCGLAIKIGICQHQNQIWRMTNEDSYSYKDCFNGNSACGFFALFDGYNGSTSARKCSDYLGQHLSEELNVIPHDVSDSKTGNGGRRQLVKEAIAKTFTRMDKSLSQGDQEQSSIRWSGCSVSLCYLEDQKLYVANTGDVRALLVRGDGSAVCLTRKHTPRDKREKERVEKSKGIVSFGKRTALVNGLVSSTRGLGNHGDSHLKRVVINKPKIKVTDLENSDQFIIMFTAGVWEVFSEEEVMFVLEDIMPDSTEIDNLTKHFQKSNPESHEEKPMSVEGQKVASEEKVAESVEHSQLENGNEEIKGTTWQNDEKPELNKAISLNSMNKSMVLNRETTLYKTNKASYLAKALAERLVYGALLAGSRNNISVMIILLKGCPVNLYLLPTSRRKSVAKTVI